MTSARWVTIGKAEEITGLPSSFFHERTGTSGIWPEGPIWKWFEGRKLINIDALYGLIEHTPSVQSNRGRRKTCPDNQQHAHPA